MLKSMTGFGRGEYSDERVFLTVEIKAVNHRYSEIVVRMPRVLNPLEDKVRRQISQVANRGRLDVFINLTDSEPGSCEIKIDREMVLAWNNAIDEVTNISGAKETIEGAQRVNFLLRSNGVINTKETQSDVEFYLPFLTQAVDGALKNLLAMRKVEGENIHNDLLSRVDIIAEYLSQVEEKAPNVAKEFHNKIKERVAELIKDYEVNLDEDKIIHEVALFADRTNITEEIVRLKSHIKQFKSTLELDKPVGRKLDFIIQEFNREVNTIASKANDFSITQITIEMKSEIEKIREQVQNIE